MRTITFTEELLTIALDNVQCLSDLGPELIAAAVFGQQPWGPTYEQELPERGTQHQFTTTQNCFHDFTGVWWDNNGTIKTGRECRNCGFFVEDAPQPFPTPEVDMAQTVSDSLKDAYHERISLSDAAAVICAAHESIVRNGLNELSAQHDRTVEALKKEAARSEQHRNDQADLIVSLRTEVAALRAKAVEQKESEQPEILAYLVNGVVIMRKFAHENLIANSENEQELMTVAQHERIVGTLRSEIAERLEDVRLIALARDVNAEQAERWRATAETEAESRIAERKLWVAKIAELEAENFALAAKIRECLTLAFEEIALHVDANKCRDPRSRVRRAAALANEIHAALPVPQPPKER